jgi:predicted dehydrogenase
MRKIKWGIISTANIGVAKVIPAMQQSKYCDIVAISSRTFPQAEKAAEKLGIPKAYGTYEEMLADPEIEAVYNPLPNHLHVPLSIKALEAGKHVLCEKPISLDTAEAQFLLDESKKYPHLKVMEAFMYRFHPQWRKAKELVQNGDIGELKTIQSIFTYHNLDPQNVRNIAGIGGGGLMDIGCYAISLSRFIFGAEPKRVRGDLEIDPKFNVDRMASGVLDFDGGTATFTVGTQLSAYQRVNILGTLGRIEIEIPFNAPPDKPTRLWLQRAKEIKEKTFDICDQYAVQGDEFSSAILNDNPVPIPLDDAVANMKVIDALFASNKSGTWQALL